MTYTDRELMVIAAAREIRDGELVFVGMRLPLLAFALAKRTHAPNALALFENGVMRESPALETVLTVSEPSNVAGALWSTTTANIMAMLQQGLVDMGFIGGAEVDKHGNLNTSYIGGWKNPKVKLPGSGGGADIAGLSKRFVIVMAQEKHRFRERVDYITSPGHGDGRDWRRKVGLTGGGPSALITTLGVFRFDPETKEAYLTSYHPGQSVESVRSQTGWDLKVTTDTAPTPEPTPAELEVVRSCDPQGFWTR